MGQFDAVFSNAAENGAANFRRELLRREDARKVAGKIFDELRGNMSSAVCHRRSEKPLLPNLIKRRKKGIAAQHEIFILFRFVIYAAYQHGCGKARIL